MLRRMTICSEVNFSSIPHRKIKMEKSMEMSFFALPSHSSEQWAFQNGVFPDKQWFPRASYYIHHFDNDPVRGHLLGH